jgi:hypothetical protein
MAAIEDEKRDDPEPPVPAVTTPLDTGVDININSSTEKHYADEWKEARDREWNMIVNKKVFEVVERPADPNVTVIDSRFIYRRKFNAVGELVKYKARLVARGYQEVAGIDYGEVFTPQPRHATWRWVLALAVQLGLITRQIDVVGAFLETPVPEGLKYETG